MLKMGPQKVTFIDRRSLFEGGRYLLSDCIELLCLSYLKDKQINI